MYQENEEKQALYRFTQVNDYENPSHIFALDYYEPGSQGRDEFSRKEAWFYYMGGDDLKEEFTSQLEELLEDLFVNNSVDWDYFTLAPSHEKDSFNRNMMEICEELAKNKDMEYRQVLRRARGVNESQELGSVKQRLINQKNSIEVTEDVEGDNIIIIDNVSVSGVYLTYCTEKLLEAGAKRVSCVCLGVTNHERGVMQLDEGVTASTAIDAEGGDR